MLFHTGAIGQWYEVEGPIHWDVHGNQPPHRIPNGFHCSDDIIYCQDPVLTQYIAQVEVDGNSIIYDKIQCWQRMRVVSVKAWPVSKSILTIDWAEGQCHERWAAIFPGEAAVYEMKNYQGQWADMLAVITQGPKSFPQP